MNFLNLYKKFIEIGKDCIYIFANLLPSDLLVVIFYRFKNIGSQIVHIKTYRCFAIKQKKEIRIEDESKLRVGFVTTWNTRCGLATFSKYIINALRDLGVEVIVFAEHTPMTEFADEDFVIRCWSRKDSDYCDLLKEIKKSSVNLIHFQHEYSLFPRDGLLFKLLDGLEKEEIRTAISIHWAGVSIDKFVGNFVDVIIFHNVYLKKFYNTYTSFKDKTYFIEYGIPNIRAEDKYELRKLNNIKSNHIIASFGFMNMFKKNCFANVIKAVHSIKEKFPDILYFIISPRHPYFPFSDQCYKELKIMVKRLKLAENVLFIEESLPEEKVFRLLHMADIIIQYFNAKKRSQSGSTKICMAAKRPVITSNTIFFSDMNDEVIKIRPHRPDLLAKTIVGLFNDEVKQRELVQNAIKYIERNNYQKVALKLIKAYLKK